MRFIVADEDRGVVATGRVRSGPDPAELLRRPAGIRVIMQGAPLMFVAVLRASPGEPRDPGAESSLTSVVKEPTSPPPRST